MQREADWPVPAGLVRTDHAEPSVFTPENLLREARRQLGRAEGDVPEACLLDPDGDVVRWLQGTGRGQRLETWACFHTDLWVTDVDGIPLGVVGNAVGASFAVLVAEELFGSGCKFVVSVTSAGQLDSTLTLPCTILIDRALRGEGTSYAYLPPSPYAAGDDALLRPVAEALRQAGIAATRGGTWTTDAPFRETRSAIAAATAAGLLAVEMEAAALYAFGRARGKSVVCFALVTNEMAQAGADFEKGPDNGVNHAFALAAAAVRGWRAIR